MSATANHMDMLVDEAGHNLESFGIEDVDIEPVGQLQVTSDVDDLTVANQDIIHAEMLGSIDVGILYKREHLERIKE